MPRQIVVRAPNHLGDFIMALPMITEVKEAYPDSELTLLLPEHLSSLMVNHVAVDHVIPIPPEHLHGVLAIFKVKALLEKQKYDVGYVLPPSFGAASAFKLAGVKERIGYIADGRRLLLTKPLALPEPMNSVHRSELYFNLLRRGSGAELTYNRPKLFLHDDDIQAAKDLLVSFGVAEEQPFFVIGFRSKAESRRWGQERYAALCKQLIDEYGYHLLLVGSKEDASIGDWIIQAVDSPKVINLSGKNSLREVGAIMSMSRLFVGDDSGPAHLAASVGSRVVVLFGAGDPQATSPLAWHAQILYRSELPCISCLKNSCPLSGDGKMACLSGISVEMVQSAVRELLRS